MSDISEMDKNRVSNHPAHWEDTVLPEQCREAAEALERAFIWSLSTEGHSHWNAVYERLLEIAETAPPQSGDGQ